MDAVSVERYRYILQHEGQTFSLLTPPTAAPREGRIAHLYKEVVVHDEDGNAVGQRRERGNPVTILRVDKPCDFLAISLDVARGCGHKTVQGLQEAWATKHPRSPLAVAVWFVLGDWRDRDVFLDWTGSAGGEIRGFGTGYTMNPRRSMDPDAPALSREEIEHLSSVNRQKDDARRAKTSVNLADETPSQRLLRLQRAVDRMGNEAAQAIRQEMRIISQRIDRAERRPE